MGAGALGMPRSFDSNLRRKEGFQKNKNLCRVGYLEAFCAHAVYTTIFVCYSRDRVGGERSPSVWPAKPGRRQMQIHK